MLNKTQIRVSFVEKHQLIREAIISLFKNDEFITIISEAEKIKDFTSGTADDTDVLLVENSEPLENFIPQIIALKKQHPELKIIAFTDVEDTISNLQKMLEAGICGYLTKKASQEELLHCIRKVFDEGIYICTAFVLRMLRTPFHISKNTTVELKPAEMQVLNFIAAGLTNNEISQKLFVSVRTIETRRKKLLEKTGTTNTATLIKFALQTGIIV